MSVLSVLSLLRARSRLSVHINSTSQSLPEICTQFNTRRPLFSDLHQDIYGPNLPSNDFFYQSLEMFCDNLSEMWNGIGWRVRITIPGWISSKNKTVFQSYYHHAKMSWNQPVGLMYFIIDQVNIKLFINSWLDVVSHCAR